MRDGGDVGERITPSSGGRRAIIPVCQRSQESVFYLVTLSSNENSIYCIVPIHVSLQRPFKDSSNPQICVLIVPQGLCLFYFAPEDESDIENTSLGRLFPGLVV